MPPSMIKVETTEVTEIERPLETTKEVEMIQRDEEEMAVTSSDSAAAQEMHYIISGKQRILF